MTHPDGGGGSAGRAERVLSPHDPDYPRRLLDLGAEAPPRIRLRGLLPAAAPTVAIVGTRGADPEAEAFTGALAAALAAEGVWVVSGGAAGVDRAAHEGALAAGGAGGTLVVLATGFAPPYPPSLAEALPRWLAGPAALATEVDDGTDPRPHRFLERNRLVAAWADAVVVVQAPRRSGALSTAAWARRLRRPLLVAPAAPWDARGAGNLELLGAGATLCRGAADVAAALGLAAPAAAAPAPRAARARPPDDADARAVWARLGHRPRHPDELALRTGLAPPRLQRALLLLLLAGQAEERAGGRWARPAGAP